MTRFASWMLALAVLAALAGPLVVPVEPFYASSDSMSPLIEEGDLYFVMETDDVQVGDVVTFESPGREGYVTHRIVAVDGESYITRGDANPSNDQAAGLPPVDPGDVVGRMLTVGGQPIVLEGAGDAMRLLSGVRLPLVAIGVGIIVLSRFVGGRSVEGRAVLHVKDLLVPLLVGGVVLAGAVAVLGWSTHRVGFVAVEGMATSARTVPVGTAVERTVTVAASTPPFTTVVIDAAGLSTVERTVDGATVQLSIEVPALSRPGPYSGRVSVFAYPSTLPRGVLERLHAAHPAAALLGSLSVVFGPLGLVYLAFLDGAEPLHRRPSRWRRWIRREMGL